MLLLHSYRVQQPPPPPLVTIDSTPPGHKTPIPVDDAAAPRAVFYTTLLLLPDRGGKINSLDCRCASTTKAAGEPFGAYEGRLRDVGGKIYAA